ncbi:MAG: glycosyltransferase family 4 protein [Ferruginibacter sp.]
MSGAEKHLKHLLPALKAQEVDCELLIICPPAAESILDEFCREFSAAGVKASLLIVKRQFSLGTLRKLNSFLRKNNFSTVHSHLIRTDLMLSLVKQFFYKRLSIISTKHGYREKVQKHYLPGAFTVRRDLYYWVNRYALSRISRNISVSAAISGLFKNLELTEKYFPVIYHGVDVAVPPERDYLTFDKNSTPQLLIVGRLEEYKGHRYAFEAMPLILEKFPGTELVLIGEGYYENELRALAGELKISDRVRFMGFQKDPDPFFNAADVVIVPSLFEPFGLVFIESMGLKKPIACFDVPAGNELLDDDSAVLAPRADSKALAEKILFLLENPAERKRLAERAFATYIEKHTATVMAKNTAAFYRSSE